MKLASVVAINSIRAACKQLGIKFTAVSDLSDSAVKRLGISFVAKNLPIVAVVEAGFFLIEIDVAGNAYVTDRTGTDDAFVFSMAKSLANGSTVEDIFAKFISKTLSETPAITDNDTLSVFKNLSNVASMTDSFINSKTKVLNNTVGATDDFDGAASINDDQEMQFIKNVTNVATIADVLNSVVVYTRNFTESPSMVDEESWNLGKNITELPSLTDAGSLRSQGYCDFTFFAEDFVGASRTF
tara:strand:+ start:1233 stop:1958 length:726 start_codon:yes stop_codon:yes gene_type:complete